MKPIPHSLCLDANIFLSALYPYELAHEECLETMKFIAENNINLFEPAIVVFEVTSSIHQKCHAGEIPENKRDESIETFLNLPILLEWQMPLLKKSAQLASQMKVKRIYDCSYLALATTRNIPLVTNDEQLLKNGKKLYPKVFSAEQFCHSFI